MKVKKIPPKEFKEIYSKVPRFCVDLLIETDDGVLLSKRDIPPDKGFWHFPGGTVLLGETTFDAVKRVAREELNTKIKILNLVTVLNYNQGSGLGYPITAVYLVKPLKNKLVGGEQARTIGFFKQPPTKTLPEVKKFLKKYQRSY